MVWAVVARGGRESSLSERRREKWSSVFRSAVQHKPDVARRSQLNNLVRNDRSHHSSALSGFGEVSVRQAIAIMLASI